MSAQQIVAKLWCSCNLWRDDAVSYRGCAEQVTYVQCPETAHESTPTTWLQPSSILAALDWLELFKPEAGDARGAFVTPATSLAQPAPIAEPA
jgi:hypothetical protein